MQNIEYTVNKIAEEWAAFQTKAATAVDQKILTDLQQTIKQHNIKIDEFETYLNRPSNQLTEKSYNMTNFLRHGNTDDLETKSFNSESDDTGGYLVNASFYNKIISKIVAGTPIRQLATVSTISTNSLDLILEKNDLIYGWINETSSRPVTDTTTFTKKRILIHELYSQPKASQRLIDDAEINIEQWLLDRLSEIFIAAENKAFINGDGNVKPRGILSYSSSDIDQITTNSNHISADDLIDLLNSLPEIYAQNATFLMNRKTLAAIQKLTDKNGRFIWQPAISQMLTESLFGIPVVTCADMPDIATNNLAIAVADFKAAYHIVDRKGLSIMRDPYTEKPFVKFYATKRVGGDVVQPEAIKLLKIK